MQKMPSMPSGRSNAASSKLRRGDQGGGSGFLALVLVVVSLMLFTLNVREDGSGPFTALGNATQTIVTPLRMLGAGVMSPLSGLGNVVRNLTAEEKTLTELEEENARLVARNVELEEAQITAQRLQELLDLRSTYNLQSMAARVIAGSTDSWTATVTIDRGSMAGLTVGMPVMDESGAVGQIISCGATTSTVRLLSDESSSVSAMVQSTRAQGMLEGSVDGTLRLAYIRTDQTVNVGDIVVTSGLGGVFPKSVPIGRVYSVESSPGSLYYEIVVEPFATARMLEEVLVVTSLTEEQEATAEDIQVADNADLAALDGAAAVSSDGTQATDDAESDESRSTAGTSARTGSAIDPQSSTKEGDEYGEGSTADEPALVGQDETAGEG